MGGLAVSVSSTTYTNARFTACTSSSATVDSCNDVGPLFPYTDGYSVGAGTCTPELDRDSVHAKSAPGTTLSKATSLTLPIGLLNIKVVGADGQPISGRTVSATVTDAHNAPCAGTFTLATTDGSGTSSAALPYETYKITAGAATAVLDVGPTSVSVMTVTNPTVPVVKQTCYLPNPVILVT